MYSPFSSAALIGGAIMGLLTSYIAYRRGRNLYLWFAIGFLFGIFGVMGIFFATRNKKKEIPIASEPVPVPQPIIVGPIDKFWYYLDPAHVQQGPMSHDALTSAWREGKITPNTYVWHEDLSDWKPLQELVKTI